jgi:hypothetical protein
MPVHLPACPGQLGSAADQIRNANLEPSIDDNDNTGPDFSLVSASRDRLIEFGGLQAFHAGSIWRLAVQTATGPHVAEFEIFPIGNGKH